MELVTPDQQSLMMKRQAHFKKMAEPYSTLEDFYDGTQEIFEIFGCELSLDENFVSIEVKLDYTDYEEYFVIVGKDGKLTVSDTLQWQDNFCANSFTNFHTKEDVDWEDVFDSNDNKTI